jgi:predicted nucleic acid-binding protein
VIYVLDACVVIAHFDPDDAHHVAATAAIADAAGGSLRAHPLTMAECLVSAVAAGRGDDMAEQISVMGVETVEVDSEAPMRLARLRVASRLRMPDCCVIDAAQQTDASIITFDDRLAAAATKLGLAVAQGRPPNA